MVPSPNPDDTGPIVCCPMGLPGHGRLRQSLDSNPESLVAQLGLRCSPLDHFATREACPVQYKPGISREEHSYPTCQWPSKVSTCPLKSVTTPNCSQFKTLVRKTSTQMSFPETVSDSLQKFFGCANPQFHLLSGGLVSYDPQGRQGSLVVRALD